VAGGQRRLQNEELHNFHYSLNIIRLLISRRVRWVGHVARVGNIRTRLWLERLEWRHHLEDLDIDEKVTLEQILKK